MMYNQGGEISYMMKKIRKTEIDEHASKGLYVIQNVSPAHIQVTSDGKYAKRGDIVALDELAPCCATALANGMIQLLAAPPESYIAKSESNKSTSGKKSRKSSDAAQVAAPAESTSISPPSAELEEPRVDHSPSADEEDVAIVENETSPTSGPGGFGNELSESSAPITEDVVPNDEQ